jgi:membrane protease YdiL (CAAX protease family)
MLLVIVLLIFSFLSARSQHKFSARHGRALLYAMTMGWEWLLVAGIAFGCRRQLKLRDLVGGRWQSAQDVLLDVGLALGFWVAAVAVLAVLGYALGLAHANQIAEARQKLGFLIPRSPLEMSLFLALSATAGVCEEIIFRGYFQRQFAAFTRTVTGGLVLQAMLFGAGHAYEGGVRMILVAIYGVMFGALALTRNSLRPGMLAHFLHDSSAGLALRHLR